MQDIMSNKIIIFRFFFKRIPMNLFIFQTKKNLEQKDKQKDKKITLEIEKMPMVSLQLPDDILKRFDEFQQESGFNSRSEALRGAILNWLNSISDLNKLKGLIRMIISVVYEPDLESIEEFSRTDHLYEEIIKIYSEYTVEKERIKVYTVIGDISKIKDFMRDLHKIRNVQVSFMTL